MEFRTVVQQRLSGNQQFQGGMEGRKPLHFKSAAATCAVRGEFLRSGAYQCLPARCSVRKSHWLFLRALTTPAEQKFILCAFAAWGSQRPENRPVACFQRERAGRPWMSKTREAKARGFPAGGRVPLPRAVQQPLFFRFCCALSGFPRFRENQAFSTARKVWRR